MEWLLIIVLVWTQPSVQVIKVPIATKALCEEAAKQVRTELGGAAAMATIDRGYAIPEGVLTTCVKVSP